MLCDAHNHFHDARLAPHRAAILQELAALDYGAAVVNGTRESDWDAVAELAAAHAWAIPSFGLHPWNAPERSPGWLEKLRAHLAAHAGAGVGEIGLDRWIERHDLPDQREVFLAQLALAAKENRAVTIHCVQAWGALSEIIGRSALPERGFLVHAYGGSLEMMRELAARCAYFSFSPYFLHERKTAAREVFAAIPLDRLLVETDAPDLRPPDERNAHPLSNAAGEPINHPANIDLAYSGLAEIRGLPRAELEQIVAENFRRFFGRV